MKPTTLVDSPKTAWNIRRRLLITAGALAAGVALYLGVSGWVVSYMLTPPPPCPDRTPAESGLVAEKLSFESAVDRIRLAGWLLPPTGDRDRRAIVLAHGRGSNAWTRTQEDIARAYVEAGFHVLAYDSRGRGHSGGDLLGLGWHERRDVRAAVGLLLGRGFKPGWIGIHGMSYGAATALLSAAAIPEIGAVVADSAFADARDLMVGEIARETGLPPFVTTLLRPGLALVARLVYDLDLDVMPPELAVPAIAPRPILFIHGREDARIPFEQARRLKAASKNPADELWPLDGYGHTEGVRIGGPRCVGAPSPMRERYLTKVTAFFERSLR